MAESAVMEAHGLALRRDAKGCLAALGDAETSFSSAGSDVPEWLRYSDAAYMAAKFAHCFRDLGRPDEAERFARRSLGMTEGYDRGRLFNTALLASILADQRRVEEACAAGTSALRMAGNMHSVRTVAYLEDVARRLQPFRAEPVVQVLYAEMAAQRRLTTSNWDLYDTRHVVFEPRGITPSALKAGYDWSYRAFYEWPAIVKAASAHGSLKHSLKHLAYSAGWKKFEPAWDFVIRLRQLAQMRPMLEAILSPVRKADKPKDGVVGLNSHQPV